MDAQKKLEALRKIIKTHKLAGYVQPVHDQYLSEYPPACNRRVEWLTGFAGSAGTVAVLADKAAIFVDGRYTLQARNEVDAALYEQHNIASMMPEAWLAEQLSDAKIGYDPHLYTQDMIRRMEATLSRKHITLVPVANLVDAVWKDRPAEPFSPVFIHETRYAGEEAAAKCLRIAELTAETGAEACLITAPDAVNWLLNIRGRDVENTPLALSVAIVDTAEKVRLYIDPRRCDDKVRAHLGKKVELCVPSHIESDLKALGRKKKRVLCASQSVPVWFRQVLQEAGAQIIEGQDPCLLPKAIKNNIQLDGIRAAHLRDGAAVVKLMHWVEQTVRKREVTELEIMEKLLEFRAMHPMFVEPSFTTIAGSGPNGAIVHYRASQKSNRTLQAGELLLLDSGGQYPDGTTDITRTMPIGAPQAEHRECFTRVLKGHIAIASALFPEGTSGSQLDALARQYLWQVGLDYDHGTGHGVGQFLGVHEGPQRISKRGGDVPLKPGMIISNEPGYYKGGEFGIRIENLVAVIEPRRGWLALETVTCAPIDTRLVKGSLLSDEEKQWINGYHAWVLEALAPAMDESQLEWLESRCAAI